MQIMMLFVTTLVLLSYYPTTSQAAATKTNVAEIETNAFGMHHRNDEVLVESRSGSEKTKYTQPNGQRAIRDTGRTLLRQNTNIITYTNKKQILSIKPKKVDASAISGNAPNAPVNITLDDKNSNTSNHPSFGTKTTQLPENLTTDDVIEAASDRSTPNVTATSAFSTESPPPTSPSLSEGNNTSAEITSSPTESYMTIELSVFCALLVALTIVSIICYGWMKYSKTQKRGENTAAHEKQKCKLLHDDNDHTNVTGAQPNNNHIEEPFPVCNK